MRKYEDRHSNSINILSHRSFIAALAAGVIALSAGCAGEFEALDKDLEGEFADVALHEQVHLDETVAADEYHLMAPSGDCTIHCGDGTIVGVECNGSCDFTERSCPGERGSVECVPTGQRVACSNECTAPPCDPCYYNGVAYQCGEGSTLGARCSAKFNGYCIGGVRAGEPCVASGECYATCSDGQWQPTI